MKTGGAKYLDDLNDQQRLAVVCVDRPTLILAGAGSGKTRTVTYKIAYLIDQRVCSPQQILAVTFTNKAAEEMRSRVERLLQGLPNPPLVCTFHSFAVRVLRRGAALLGYGNDFSICDADDQKRVVKRVYEELGFVDSLLPVRKTQAIISRSKNRGDGAQEYLEASKDPDAPEIARVFERYQRYLKDSNAMDFDDLILLTVRLFAERPEVRERYGRQYQYLLVDEYQDTNRPQYDLIRDLTCVHQNITAVGDEDQSIYGFRGADIENILRFESDFKNAVVIKLEENYRSTQTILSAATSVVSHNRRRKGKVLWTRNGEGAPLELYAASTPQDEARQVARRIAGHLRRQEGPAVVLYRTNFQSRQFEESLREVRIPYKVVGSVSFFDRKEVKDALAYLRVTANPEDSVALLRIINEPPRGIGATTLARLNEAARDKNVSLWGAVQGGLTGRDFAARTHLALQRLTELIETQRQRLAFPLHELLQGVLEASGYLSALKTESTPEAEERILNLRELVTLASEYSNRGQTLQEFLDQAMLHTDADDYDEKAQVSLMTLHNAKGLEFPIVFMVGLEEGTFPHSRCSTPDDIEEERRLCYVGMTRAQNALYLSYSQGRRFYSSDLPASNPPSRFLQAIPKQLIRGPAHGRSEFAAFPRGTFTGVTFDTPDQMRRRLEGMSRPGQGVKGFRPGATVEHGHYGRGRVLQVQETGDDLKITVQFPGVGIKKMLQGFAKLKLV